MARECTESECLVIYLFAIDIASYFSMGLSSGVIHCEVVHVIVNFFLIMFMKCLRLRRSCSLRAFGAPHWLRSRDKEKIVRLAEDLCIVEVEKSTRIV